MRLTARDMKRLDNDARAIETRGALTYLADAQRCLLDTRDPIEALALLRALWRSSHAKRDKQKDALAAAGNWLEGRIRREFGVSPDRLSVEIGWLQRLVMVCGFPDDDSDDDRSPSRSNAEAPFGAHIDIFRRKRKAALAAAKTAGSREEPGPTPEPPPPTQLPEVFEVCFTSWQAALKAFKTARKRCKDGKPPRDSLLDVIPVATELRHLADNLACSLLHTDGMAELVDHKGDLPNFWIAASDLAPRDGKRIPSRISFAPPGRRAP
jgi:hypothetical protein